eukprot:UN31454
MYSVICVVLTIFAGIMSGLNIGLFSIDDLEMKFQQEAGDEEEKERTQILANLLSEHHRLLVTVVLCNASAMEMLPIFLDRLLGPVLATIISVTAVLILGEIVPQAICTKNPYGCGARFSPFLIFLKYLCYPIVWPIAYALDYLLDEDIKVKRLLDTTTDWRTLLTLINEDKIHAGPNRQEVDDILLSYAQGLFHLPEYKVHQHMQSWKIVHTLNGDDYLTPEVLGDIKKYGKSRYPVWRISRHNIFGLLIVKDLIGEQDLHKKKISEFVYQ